MKRTLFLIIVGSAALALILFGGFNPAEQAFAQDDMPDLPGAVPEVVSAAELGTGFTYQGRLEKGSGAVNGTCAFKFSLWDAKSGGNQKGNVQTVTGVSVSNGNFSVVLNKLGEFGSDAFLGEARFLQIKVKCGGDSSYILMNGRVEINAAPYALSLMPGAKIESDGTALRLSSTTTGSVLSVTSKASNGAPAAVYGQSTADNGAGISGYNSKKGYGVYGSSLNGTGVYGEARSTSGNNAGVLGVANSTQGVGAAGYADATVGINYGVYGQSSSDAGHGVYGYAASANGITYGVYGKADSLAGEGVHGEGGYYGMYGVGTDPVGVSYGVRGETRSSDDSSYGGYFLNSNNVALFAAGNDANERTPGDLRLGGDFGVISADRYGHSSMSLLSNDDVIVYLDNNDDNNASCFSVYDPGDSSIVPIWEVCHTAAAASVPATTVQTQEAGARQLYGVSSPQVWIEDFGTGRMVDGAAVIEIDPVYAQTVNLEAYHVFLTPLGDCAGLYVSAKAATSFEVRELGSGNSSLDFDYRIVAQQLGYEEVRMEEARVSTE